MERVLANGSKWRLSNEKKDINPFFTLSCILNISAQEIEPIEITDAQNMNNLLTFEFFDSPYIHWYNSTQLVFENISFEDFQQIYQRLKSRTSDIFPAYNRIAEGTIPFTLKESREGYTSDLFSFTYDSLVYNIAPSTLNVVAPPNVYDPEKSIGILYITTETGLSRNTVYNSELYHDDSIIIKNLINPNIYPMIGYFVVLKYTAKGLSIEGKSEGDIVIGVLLDALSEVSIGGYTSTTGKNGVFEFVGNASFSRITEGIILIIDEDGNEVIATKNDETGKWFVEVSGKDAGKDINFQLDIDSLNF